MRTLILNTYDTKGGAARAAYRLHQGLQLIGIDSKMLVQTKYGNDDTVIGPNSTIGKGIGLIRPSIDKLPLYFYPKWNKILFSTSFLPDRLNTKITEMECDIINLHWIAGGFLNLKTLHKFTKPLVWTLHDSWAFTGGCHIPFQCKLYTDSCGMCPTLGSSRNYDLSRLNLQRKQKAWKDLDITVVAPSRWLADQAKSSALFCNSRIEVIPNGLNLSIYKPLDKAIARDLFSLPQEKKLILFGAMDSTSDFNKGFHLLKLALQKLASRKLTKEIELIIFGASKPAEPMNFGFNTHYLGHLYDDVSLAILYSAADVMVVPSIQEAFGQTASEAMSCGTPVVAFGATGLLDIVEHKRTGYLAQAFDPDDLAEGIQWVLENDERRQNLSYQSRKKVEDNFSIDIVAQRYAELYQDIIK